MHSERFVKGTERLVDPMTVGSSHFMQPLLGMVPLGMQRKLLEGASSSTPYMGFVVEPYAFFLFYELKNIERAAKLLPRGFRLAKTCAFDGDAPAHYAIISFFRVHASTFWGSRAEFYLVAENEQTGLLSWVMIDYLSDTIGYDRANGLRGPSAPQTVITTSSDARVIVDLGDGSDVPPVAFDASLVGARMRPLDRRLWIEGNLSVAYGPHLSPDNPGVFSLTFSPSEMEQALEVPLPNVSVGHMSWYSELLADAPAKAVCFPYAQHLLSDSPGTSSNYASADELVQAINDVDFETIPRFSAAPTRKGIMVGTMASLGIVVTLLTALALT